MKPRVAPSSARLLSPLLLLGALVGTVPCGVAAAAAAAFPRLSLGALLVAGGVSARESRFGDPVDPPGGGGGGGDAAPSGGDAAPSGGSEIDAASMAEMEAKLAEVAGDTPMVATVKKGGKVVRDFPTSAGSATGPPKLADGLETFLLKVGAPPQPAVAAAKFAAQRFGVYTAHELKDAVPLLCEEKAEDDPEDCWGFIGDVINDHNGAHMIQGALRYLKTEYDEKGFERPWGTLTLEELREACVEKETCLTDEELEAQEAQEAEAAAADPAAAQAAREAQAAQEAQHAEAVEETARLAKKAAQAAARRAAQQGEQGKGEL
jgi:hypothetical protein